jgi:hypothetical protein
MLIMCMGPARYVPAAYVCRIIREYLCNSTSVSVMLHCFHSLAHVRAYQITFTVQHANFNVQIWIRIGEIVD